MLAAVDYVPPTLPKLTGSGRCIIFEDNDAVIKMTMKGRSPALRHVARTHRIDIDWLFERLREDPGLFMRYCGSKDMIADIFTKGPFTREAWIRLCNLAQIGPYVSNKKGSRLSIGGK